MSVYKDNYNYAYSKISHTRLNALYHLHEHTHHGKMQAAYIRSDRRQNKPAALVDSDHTIPYSWPDEAKTV